MGRLVYLTSKGAIEEVHGSDTRLNVSSRVDSRSFYVSRDNGQSYVLVSEDDDAVAADIITYLKNTSSSLKMFIRDVEISCENAATIKVHLGDATTATGTPLTSTNLNRNSKNAADVSAFGNAAVGGVASSILLAVQRCPAGNNVHFEFNDSLILGQNDNIFVEYDTGNQGDVEVATYFYMDTLG